MRNLLVMMIVVSVVVFVVMNFKNSEFAKRLNKFIFEEQDGDETIVLTDSKTDETDSAKTEPADSKTDEAKPAESKTDEADSAEADSTDSKTDSEELPDFLEYELNEEKKRLKMMRKTSLKMVEKSFDKLEKQLNLKPNQRLKILKLKPMSM